jgi:hypothetical protein
MASRDDEYGRPGARRTHGCFSGLTQLSRAVTRTLRVCHLTTALDPAMVFGLRSLRPIQRPKTQDLRPKTKDLQKGGAE